MHNVVNVVCSTIHSIDVVYRICASVSGCRVLTTDEVIECNFLLDGLMILTNNWILGY